MTSVDQAPKTEAAPPPPSSPGPHPTRSAPRPAPPHRPRGLVEPRMAAQDPARHPFLPRLTAPAPVAPVPPGPTDTPGGTIGRK